jgi:hypothetical protein
MGTRKGGRASGRDILGISASTSDRWAFDRPGSGSVHTLWCLRRFPGARCATPDGLAMPPVAEDALHGTRCCRLGPNRRKLAGKQDQRSAITNVVSILRINQVTTSRSPIIIPIGT